MNLYKLYKNPKQLYAYDKASEIVPEIVYELATKGVKLTPVQLQTLAKNATYAYPYARDVIKGRFPEGEKAIASDAELAYCYALEAIKGRFPEGEKAIKGSERAHDYKDFLRSLEC